MKAMVLTAPGELVLDEVARPAAGAGQVLVRMTHSGICGTDYKIFNGSIPVRIRASWVTRWWARSLMLADTDRVPRRRSGHRRSGALLRRLFSLPDRPDAPLPERHADRPGRATAGSPSTSLRRRARFSSCPTSIDIRHAPLIQVLTTCLHAQRQIEIFPGESVVVLGLGVTGQLHVQLAKARGRNRSLA